MTALRILVVEDDETVRRSVVRQLRQRGDHVVAAATCRDARSAGTFGIGVFDVDLPDGNGIELAGELLAQGSVKAVVFHTGHASQPARELGTVVLKGASDELLAQVEAARARVGVSRPN
jgi:DNA-binding response OmpR family regulator